MATKTETSRIQERDLEAAAAFGAAAVSALPFRYAPRPTSDHTVLRKDLLRNLTEATLLKQVSIVRGPAGSGKTTLLGQWRSISRDMGLPVGWLTLDKADRDPQRFVAGLAVAIDSAGRHDVAAAIRCALGEGGASPVELARTIAAICNRAGDRITIVLDQYEEADCADVGEILSGFVNHSIDARLVVASRTRPMIPLASLRARDQVFEIAPSDLNLTPIETHGLFAGVPELYTRRLHYETSGEAVALGFARRVMAVSQREQAGAEGWQDQLYEYYRSEVLDVLPPDMREGLSRLVAVERFDLSLAGALLGRGAIALIERLYHVDGTLLRHRGTREFYFPEMLRCFLETRLAWLSDDEHRALHRRAAQWFEERGRHAEALRHAVDAGDREHALRLLDRVGYASLVLQHGVLSAHKLLQAIAITPDDMPTAHHLSLAMVLVHEGALDRSAFHLDIARTALAGADENAQTAAEQLMLVEAVVAGLSDDFNYAENASSLLRLLEKTSPSDHASRAQAQVLLSWYNYRGGDIEGAARLIESADRDYSETDSVYGSVFLQVHRVLVCYWSNDLDSALQEIILADQVTRIFFPDDQRLCAMMRILRAGILFELGRPDPLTDMTALAGTVGAVETWPEIQIWSHRQAVRAALAQGYVGEARGIVAYGAEVARRLNSARLEWTLRLLAVEVSLATGEIDRADQEARELDICEPYAFDHLPAALTWQERIGAAFVAARLAAAVGRHSAAEALLETAGRLIAETSATRLAVELEIARARLCQALGDGASAALHLARARQQCDRGLPIQLFLHSDESMRGHQPDVPQAASILAQLHEPSEPSDPLTMRERQILKLLGEGHQNKVAAYQLGLSEATVKFHLRNIYRKLEVQNRTQALARYRKLSAPYIN